MKKGAYKPPASAEVMSSFYDLSSLDVAARVKVSASAIGPNPMSRARQRIAVSVLNNIFQWTRD